MTRAAIYLRVSLADRQSVLEQFHQLRREARARELDIVRVYRDRRSSGGWRPGLELLVADGRCNRFDVVMVTALDRLGRSLIEILQHVDALDSRGVRVHVLGMGGLLSPRDPIGRYLLQGLSAAAELERGLIRERTRAGMARVRRLGTASGRAVGRPALELPEGAELAEAAAAGGIAALARELGVGESTIRRRLRQKGVPPAAADAPTEPAAAETSGRNGSLSAPRGVR